MRSSAVDLVFDVRWRFLCQHISKENVLFLCEHYIIPICIFPLSSRSWTISPLVWTELSVQSQATSRRHPCVQTHQRSLSRHFLAQIDHFAKEGTRTWNNLKVPGSRQWAIWLDNSNELIIAWIPLSNKNKEFTTPLHLLIRDLEGRRKSFPSEDV